MSNSEDNNEAGLHLFEASGIHKIVAILTTPTRLVWEVTAILTEENTVPG